MNPEQTKINTPEVLVVAPGDLENPHSGDVDYAAVLAGLVGSFFRTELYCFKGHSFMRPRIFYYVNLPKWVLNFTKTLMRRNGVIISFHHLGTFFWATLVEIVLGRGYTVVPYMANIEGVAHQEYLKHPLRYALNLFMWRFLIRRCGYLLADPNGVPAEVFPANCKLMRLPVYLVDMGRVNRSCGKRDEVRSSLGISSEVKVVCNIGPFHVYNRPSIPYILDNMSRFAGNTVFLMIGDVDPADIVPNERVKYLGRVDDLHAYISACDCVLIPRFVHHGSPMGKMINAMACGVPVVTNDLEGMKVTPGRDVVLGRLEELPVLVNDLLVDEGRAHMIGLNGRKHIEEHYSVDKFREPLKRFLLEAYYNHGGKDSNKR